MDINNENIEEVVEVVEVEDLESGSHTPPVTTPTCVAQVKSAPTSVTVTPSTACCDKIITEVASDIAIDMREIKCSIIKGKVKCNGSGVAGVIVVVSSTGSGPIKRYVGITNSTGEYGVCVPNSGTYSIEAYCPTCVSGVCPSAGACDCGCK